MVPKNKGKVEIARTNVAWELPLANFSLLAGHRVDGEGRGEEACSRKRGREIGDDVPMSMMTQAHSTQPMGTQCTWGLRGVGTRTAGPVCAGAVRAGSPANHCTTQPALALEDHAGLHDEPRRRTVNAVKIRN